MAPKKTIAAKAYSVQLLPEKNKLSVGQWTEDLEMLEIDTGLNELYEVELPGGKFSVLGLNVLALNRASATHLGRELIVLDLIRRVLADMPMDEQTRFVDSVLAFVGQDDEEDWTDIIYGV